MASNVRSVVEKFSRQAAHSVEGNPDPVEDFMEWIHESVRAGLNMGHSTVTNMRKSGQGTMILELERENEEAAPGEEGNFLEGELIITVKHKRH